MAYGAILGQRRGLYPQIVVTLSPAESNIQVTATYNGSTVSALSVNGVAVLNVYGYGTWIVGAEDKTQNVVVDTVKQYSVSITLTRGTPLSSITVGQFVKLNESGSPVEFYVAKHDYESGLNGAGRTLLVRKNVYDIRAWDAGNVNVYASSDINAWFNGTYKALFSSEVQTAMGTTKFYCTSDNDNYTVGTLERAVFALSVTELGESHPYANTEGSTLPIASTLQIAYRNGSATTQWTRSPFKGGPAALELSSSGSAFFRDCNDSNGSRPAFTLPGTISVDENNNIIVP